MRAIGCRPRRPTIRAESARIQAAGNSSARDGESPMQARRVAIVTHRFPPTWAGPVERFLRYAPGLRERGVDPFFITLQANGVVDATREQYRGCDVIRIPARRWRWQVESFVNGSCKWLASRPSEQRPQAAIFLSVAPLSSWSLRRLRVAGIKSIAVQTMCDPVSPRTARGRLVRYIQRLGYSNFDHVVASSQALRKNLQALGVAEEKIVIIPNGVDQSRFQPASDDRRRDLRRALRLPVVGEPVALFVGLRNPRKGVLPLVQGWKRYRDRGGNGRLVLVGKDDSRDEPELAEFFAQWDKEIEDAKEYNIEVRPSCHAIEQYFQACDLFVFLSDLEGLPNVIPEAMATRIPIMMNRYQGFSEDVAREGVDVFVTTRDPDRIAKDLASILSSGDVQRDLRESALAYVTTHHPLHKSLDKYAAIVGTKNTPG